MTDKYSVEKANEFDFKVKFPGGHTMKRLAISILILMLFASLTIDKTFAQTAPQQSLHQATVSGNIERVKELLSKGVDINLKNRQGWTPLHAAVWNQKQDIAKLLIEKGADVNVKDKSSRTALQFAADTGQKEIVELLIAKKAEVNTMNARGENALSLATKKGHKEVAAYLTEHGATEPDLEALRGDRLYSSQRGLQGPSSYPGSTGRNQGRSATAPAAQSSNEPDILADPEEIKARIKTFAGMEKELKGVADKSATELLNWQQTRHDNRTTLLRSIDKQFEDELGYVRKVAVVEKAQKTTAAIDALRTTRRKRSLKINRGLLQQKRELKEAESARTRTRGRTTGRSTRGRSSGGNATDPRYGSGAVTIPRNYAPENTARPGEQLDRQTEEQLRQWMQATTENKLELAKALQPQIRADISSIRRIAVEEEAKKTTAAIDGLLLARQERFDGLVIKLEEQKRTQQQTQQGQLNRNNQTDQRTTRTRGRTSRRGTTTQGGVQQGNTTGGRTRRR